jgi:hypothetical protein
VDSRANRKRTGAFAVRPASRIGQGAAGEWVGSAESAVPVLIGPLVTRDPGAFGAFLRFRLVLFRSRRRENSKLLTLN